MPIVTRKAFAYVTHDDRLLVFTHPFAPEAGPSDGTDVRPLFEFFWVRLPSDVPPLVAGHDGFLHVLIEHLAAEGVVSP